MWFLSFDFFFCFSSFKWNKISSSSDTQLYHNFIPIKPKLSHSFLSWKFYIWNGSLGIKWYRILSPCYLVFTLQLCKKWISIFLFKLKTYWKSRIHQACLPSYLFWFVFTFFFMQVQFTLNGVNWTIWIKVDLINY